MGERPLTDADYDRLADALNRFHGERAMNLEQLDGFFAALICGPNLVRPSEYLPEIWGGGEMADEEETALRARRRQYELRSQVEALRKQGERLRLLWEAASVLLTTEQPDAMMRGLFAKIAPHLGLDAYFNFMVDEAGDALRLESCVGIPDEEARTITRLDFGQAICGTVALRRQPITATYIQQSDDPKVQLVKGFGIRAYACNPLHGGRPAARHPVVRQPDEGHVRRRRTGVPPDGLPLRRLRLRAAAADPASCGRRTGGRTSSWRRWPTSCATRWPRSATPPSSSG